MTTRNALRDPDLGFVPFAWLAWCWTCKALTSHAAVTDGHGCEIGGACKGCGEFGRTPRECSYQKKAMDA